MEAIEFFAESLGVRLLEILSALFVAAIGAGFIALVVLYIIDRTQTKHAVRRNFPVIGRFRYLFENLGEYFRQYFFAMDREEMPFNRAQRSWVYRAAKGLDSTTAFGSTRDLSPVGTVFFVNCPFPTLEKNALQAPAMEIGPYAKRPFLAKSFFNISGMSYGAISKPAIRALSKGAREAGCWLNTGEGGLSPYHLEGGADIVFQIGTAKYGVRDKDGSLSSKRLKEIAAHDQVKMFEVKMSQGAKPGKGGILPGGKVTKEIAAIRGIPEGADSISPNRHYEIDSPAAILDMVSHVRRTTGKPTGFKMVLGAYGWLEGLMALIKKRGMRDAPDFITLDSADGGTGAAPMSLMDYMGLPLQESLPRLADILEAHRLRDRIRVVASGKLITPGRAAWALCAGADFVVSARGFMFALGCIQALQCNKNTCPTGITTHNPKLQRGLIPADKALRVRRYAETMRREVGIIAHSCGVPEPRRLQRHHARIVCSDGLSRSLESLHGPSPRASEKGKRAA